MNPWPNRMMTGLGLAVATTLTIWVPATAKQSFVDDVTPESEGTGLLAPGTSFTRTVEIHNRFHGNAKLHVQATNLVDDDNGCVDPEVEADDSGCGPGEGELSSWLQVTISTVPREGQPVEVWEGSLTELSEDDVLLVHRLPKGSRNRLLLVTTMAYEAGNDTMTDRVDYDLEWTMTQGIGKQVNVLGIDNGTTQPSGPRLRLASAASSLGEADQRAVLLLTVVALAVPLRLIRSRRTRGGRFS